MLDFPSTDVLDESICTRWRERHLHPDGLKCPSCGSQARRLFRHQGQGPAYRCRGCAGYYPLLTDTAFEKTRQRPATLVLLRRGMAKGEPTARLARELGRSRKPLHTVRQGLQAQVNATAPTKVMAGTAFEADALDQHAGETQHAPSRSRRAAPPTRPYAQRPWHLCQRAPRSSG